MSSRKYRLLILLGILFIVFGYFVLRSPLARVDNGIYLLRGVDAGEGLIWSLDGNNVAGYESVYPWPDCPVSPLFCIFAPEPHSEIFLIDTTRWERKSVIKFEFNDRMISSISWFPDGNHIAYHSDNDQLGNWGEIRLIDINGQNDISFMDGSGYLIWSPNGTKLASIETEGVPGDWYPSIYVLNVSSNQKELIFLAVEPITTVGSLSWSRDGKILAFSYGNSGRNADPKPEIFFYEVISETTHQITNDEFQYRKAEFSPTDDLIALQRVDMNLPDGIPQYTTILRDLRSNCEVELPISHTHTASWSPDGEKLVISALGNAYIVDLIEFIGADFKETRSIC